MGATTQMYTVQRILLIADSYLPMRTSTAKLVRDLAYELRQAGREVTVLAPSADIKAPIEQAVEEEVRVVRVRTMPAKGCGKLVRGIREVRFSALLWERAKEFFRAQHFDLLVYFGPTIFFGSLVRRLKLLYGCPAYLVQRDLWTKFMLNLGELRCGVRLRLMQWFEGKHYRIADVIGVQSRGDLKDVHAVLGAGRQEVEVLSNWYAESAAVKVTDFRERYGLKDKVVFFHGGNCGPAQDVSYIVRMASSLTTREHIHFLLVSWGSHVERIRRSIVMQGLANISILSTVSQEDFPGLVAECDVGIVTLDRRLEIQNVPGKLLAYLACGKPVLAAVNPGSDLKRVLKDSGAGYCCTNGDDDDFRRYVLMLAESAELRNQMGQRGRRLLRKEFSPKHAVEQILGHFEETPVSWCDTC